MLDTFYIGPVPGDETCAQLGHTLDYASVAQLECNAYIAALRRKYGAEPEGAHLRVKPQTHDFGTYYEVVVRFFSDHAEACEYASRVEEGLRRWEDAGMWAPVLYDGSQPLSVIRDPELWIRETNPRCFPTRAQFDAAQAEAASSS